jgi:hypothetical protein
MAQVLTATRGLDAATVIQALAEAAARSRAGA